METKKIPRKIREQLKRLAETPRDYKDLERINLGQKVIMFNEGVMKFVGIRYHIDDEVGEFWSNPVFLSELTENGEIKYKELEILTKSNAIYTDIIGKDNKNYDYVNQIWRNLN